MDLFEAAITPIPLPVVTKPKRVPPSPVVVARVEGACVGSYATDPGSHFNIRGRCVPCGWSMAGTTPMESAVILFNLHAAGRLG
jgi:hypothetical protein